MDTTAESEEGRALTERNAAGGTAVRTQGRGAALSGLCRVRQRAQRDKDVRFTALLHHITLELLTWSFYQLRREAAIGVDKVTWEKYRERLTESIQDLHERVHRGSYRAQPVRRMYIEKDDGGKRALGIAALEDKIVQQAVVKVLNQIYESDFKGFSYGFREGRSAHDALDALYVGIEREKVNWVLDEDRVSPSPLSGQKMPFFKVKFEPAFNDFTVPTTMSKKRDSESRYKPRSQFDSCQTLCPIPASRAVETP